MQERLPRFIGPVEGAMMVVCATVATAIFLVPGGVASNAGSVSASLLLWVAGGVLSLCGALCYAELAVRVPRSGAEYAYLHAAFGPCLAFAYAWTTLFAIPVSSAAVARGFADYLAVLWPLDESQRRIAAAAAISVFATISICSTRACTRVASLAAAGKILAVFGLACIGINAGANTSAPLSAAAATPAWAHMATAMLAVIWAYDGSSSVAIIGGEVRDPQRTLPIALFAGLAIVTALYILLNAVYFRTLGYDGVARSDAVAATTLFEVIGPQAAAIMAVLVMSSTLGTLAVQLVGNPRYFFTAAEDGHLPRVLAYISPRTLTPVNAILLTAGIAIALVTLGGYQLLIRLYVLSIYPMNALALVGTVLLRRRDGPPVQFSMPLYPWPLIVYVICIIGICAFSAVDDPLAALFGVMVPVSGAMVYAVKRRWSLRAAAVVQ